MNQPVSTCAPLPIHATTAAPQHPNENELLFRNIPILLGAHRGGRGVYPENTLYAYQHTAERWPDALLEGDLHVTADGEVIVMHDSTVDRTTNGAGAISGKSLAELKTLDAGYHFTADDGATFPFRGKGITISTLGEVLSALPMARFEMEMKDGDGIVDRTVAILRAAKAEGRALLASFNPVIMEELKKKAPELPRCYDYTDGMALVQALRGGDWTSYQANNLMLSLTWEMVQQFNVTPEEVAAIRAKGILYQVHTLNDPEAIRQAIRLPVDSILSDNPAVLADVIREQSAGAVNKNAHL